MRVSAVMAAAVVTVLAIALTWSAAPHPAPASAATSSPSAPWSLSAYRWQGDRAADTQLRAALPALQAADWRLDEWRATITSGDNGLQWVGRGGVISGLVGADSPPRHLVIRLEPSATLWLESEPMALQQAVLAAWRARRHPHDVAIQIDWDVPERLLKQYAEWLHDLRDLLPADCGLSCTGLVAWLDRPGLVAVLGVVDEIIMQCYSIEPASDPGAVDDLLVPVDPVAVARQLDRLGGRYRIALPALTQTSLYRAGECLRATLPIGPAAALAAGLRPQPVDDRWGWRWRCAVSADTTVAGQHLPKGSQLWLARPSVAGVRARIAALRAANLRRCNGVALFRLDLGGGAGFNPLQLAALVSGEPAAAAVAVTRGPGHWQISNLGAADYRAELPSAGAVLVVQPALPVSWPAPPGAHWQSQHAGHPVAPHRATESGLWLPYLASGATLPIELPADGRFHLALASTPRRHSASAPSAPVLSP